MTMRMARIICRRRGHAWQQLARAPVVGTCRRCGHVDTSGLLVLLAAVLDTGGLAAAAGIAARLPPDIREWFLAMAGKRAAHALMKEAHDLCK